MKYHNMECINTTYKHLCKISPSDHIFDRFFIMRNSIYLYIVFWHNEGIVHCHEERCHNDDVRMGAIAYEITSLTIVYSSVYSGAYQSKHQSSASLAFVWRIHRGPVNSPHKWPVTRKMFPFDDVIMCSFYAKTFHYTHDISCWLFQKTQRRQTPYSSAVMSGYGVYFVGS